MLLLRVVDPFKVVGAPAAHAAPEVAGAVLEFASWAGPLLFHY